MRIIKLPTGAFEFDPGRLLGPSGGFGQVFFGNAFDGAIVAIKKLHLSASAAAHRELDIARELKGEAFQHVIGFIDSGIDAESGEYFVVMPRAEFSLRQELARQGKFEAGPTANILLQIASGLTEVSNIVHRDLKPDNILWHENRWKIADFGIARFVEDATSSQTLKNCLSPLYAAPEQWRFERAASATDIYALSCIAYELLVGNPPFTVDPERQHQGESLPVFSCADARLSGLISLMARKPPAARPSIIRAQTVLREIVATPAAVKSGPLSDLSAAGALVAAATEQAEAKNAAATRAKRDREQLHVDAQEMLAENIGRLWEKIHLTAPVAYRETPQKNPFCVKIRLGAAVLEVGRVRGAVVAPGEFRNSNWDVVSSSTVSVMNGRTVFVYVWEVSLWYVKQSAASDFRWYEAGYFGLDQRLHPYSANGYREADFVASRINSGVNYAWGPKPIDGEDEADFHERYLWLFAKAAKGELRQPNSMPINSWPPSM